MGAAIASELSEFVEKSHTEDQPLLCNDDQGMTNLLANLLEREKQIEILEIKIQEQQQTLLVAKNEIEFSMNELVAAEDRLLSTIARSETAAEDDLSKLTAVYENMKPKDSALLFEEMAPKFAAGFIYRMRADSAAQIMTGLSPQAAYTISVILAGRNANAATE